MAPPRNTPDQHEMAYAIRDLSKGLELLRIQAEKNAADTQKNHDDVIEIKARVAMVATLFGILGAAAASLVVKLVVH